MVSVPYGHDAPYIHSRGVVYRRKADESDPVKETDREIDDRRIQADEFVFEPELFLANSLISETMEKSQEEFLIERPRAVFVRVGQGRAARGRNA